MGKVLLKAEGIKGVFSVSLGKDKIGIESTLTLLNEAEKNNFETVKWDEVLSQYTTVDSYSLYTVKPAHLKELKSLLRSEGAVVKKVSPDKLPVCWRSI